MPDSDSTTTRNKRAQRRTAAGFDAKGLLAVCFCRMLAVLPLAWARGLGAWLGRLIWALNLTEAKVCRENIGYAYPNLSPEESQALARESLIEAGKTGLEMPLVWNKGTAWVMSKVIEVVNEARYRQLLDAEQGLILLAPHHGNWEVLAHYLGATSEAITALYQPSQLPRVDQMIRKARESVINTAPTDKSGVLALVKALRRGEMVGVLPDQVPTMGAGEFADFYTKPALTMTLARQLQQKTKANVLMGHCERVPGGYKVVFTEPDPSILEPETAIAGLNKSVERVINQSPSQYQWQYKRYRRQPDGLPKPYRF